MTNADLLKNMMKASQEGGKEVCRRQGVASEDEEVTPGEESKPQRSPFYCLPIRPERGGCSTGTKITRVVARSAPAACLRR
jgi:hypothetical protein